MNKATLLALICLIIAGAAGYYFGLRVGNRRGDEAISDARQKAIEEVRKADSLLIQTLDSLVLYKEALDAAKVRVEVSGRKLKAAERQGDAIVIKTLPVDSLILDLIRIINTPR